MFRLVNYLGFKGWGQVRLSFFVQNVEKVSMYRVTSGAALVWCFVQVEK